MATLYKNTARSDIGTTFQTIYTVPVNSTSILNSIYFSNKTDVELQFDLVITINDLDFYLSRQTTLLPQCTIVIDKNVNMLSRNSLKVKTNTGTVDVFASVTELT
jgi:hypothetical protein